MSLSTVLFVVFLVLKLTGVLTWSWWWVTCPLWIPFAAILLFMVAVIVMAIVLGIVGLILK